jgi:hypothetical protein
MQFREDTPLSVVLEMHAVSFWAPATVLVIVVATLALLCRRRSTLHWRWRFAAGLAVIGFALPLIWFGFVLGSLRLLEDLVYRAYIECNPCF